ncbi:hypothetical protein Daus18300_008825 [Diaporthe australafricana]|uniref:Xylanolytic transcriptional activator regulatory domain-containing protein n=1 Tax=Diaporthe australafricana TaxID=127596 RepID=A0ABR3WHH5_9PEZI
MWALAASASTGHHQNIRDSLYQSSCRAVENLASTNASLTRCIEYIQSWLLLAIYEFMLQDFRRGWISAGRAFRLIQLAGYESTDAPNKGAPHFQAAWPEMEERRRTLWLAYCLDRLLGMRSDTPLTFSDQVLVRMPAPEVNFRNDQPARMGFLPEVVGVPESGAECDASASILAIFVGAASMCGRVTSHRHKGVAAMLTLDEKGTEEFRHRHETLGAELTQRMDEFFMNPFLSHGDDPTAVFISIMWHTVALHLAQTASYMESPCNAIGTSGSVTTGTGPMSQKSASAVQEVIKLLDQMSQLNYLKVSPSCTKLPEPHRCATNAAWLQDPPFDLSAPFPLCRNGGVGPRASKHIQTRAANYQ